jgi:hypothetical protein
MGRSQVTSEKVDVALDREFQNNFAVSSTELAEDV